MYESSSGAVRFPVGGVESSTNVNVSDVTTALPATSAAVTVAAGAELAPGFHVNAADSNGPPAGSVTAPAVCDQPVVVPPSALVAEPAPDVGSVTFVVNVKLPPTEPR